MKAEDQLTVWAKSLLKWGAWQSSQFEKQVTQNPAKVDEIGRKLNQIGQLSRYFGYI
jgi:hypothetical protein